MSVLTKPKNDERLENAEEDDNKATITYTTTTAIAV